MWGSAQADGHLVAVCTSSTGNGQRYAVASSSDRGATWSPATPAPELGRPDAAGVWVTAADPSHLVAVTHGLPTSGSSTDEPSALFSSVDGGASWAPARVVKGADNWSWAGAAGGSLVYALDGQAGTYLVSTDRGASFGEVAFRH